MKADSKTEKAVMKTLQDLSDGCASGQVQRVLDLFATDPDVVLLGSAEGEKIIGYTALKSFFKDLFSKLTFSFEWSWHLVSTENSIAWVLAEGYWRSTDQKLGGPYRLTLVLKKKGDKWLIVHYHGSEPAKYST